MRISFTGTRRGMNAWQKQQLERWLLEYHPKFSRAIGAAPLVSAAHGACSGADEEFHLMLRECCGKHVFVSGFPSTSQTRSKLSLDVDYLAPAKSPLERNPNIVDAGRDLLLVAPRLMSEELRSGTWAAVRYARRKRVKEWIMWPE